jgi:hypothetical protein
LSNLCRWLNRAAMQWVLNTVRNLLFQEFSKCPPSYCIIRRLCDVSFFPVSYFLLAPLRVGEKRRRKYLHIICFMLCYKLMVYVHYWFLGAFAKFRKAAIRFFMSVRLSACNNLAPTRRIFKKFGIVVFF